MIVMHACMMEARDVSASRRAMPALQIDKTLERKFGMGKPVSFAWQSDVVNPSAKN